MLNRLKIFLEKHKITDGKIILVGFSGGFDSLCLLDLIRHLRKNIAAVHYNHAWRDEISDSEEARAKEFCDEHGIIFYSEKATVKNKKTEEEARKLRYGFFAKCCKKFNTNILLTAHNADDNAETILYRIIKGCGIDGLCAIPEVRDCKKYKVYRPLLSIKREEIEQYIQQNGLNPSYDNSNFDVKYARNFIRHEILPQAKKINPKVCDALINLSLIARENLEIINRVSLSSNNIPPDDLSSVQNYVFPPGSAFINFPAFLQKKIIREFLIKESLDYDSKKIDEILSFIKENFTSGCGKKMSLTTGKWLFVSHEEIKILENSLKPSGKIKIKKTSRKTQKENNDKNIAAVDLSDFDIKQLEIRTRKEGDIFQPFGMSKTIKLKKYLINQKISQYKRDSLLLLADNKEILWIAGVQISEKIRIKDKITHNLIYERE